MWVLELEGVVQALVTLSLGNLGFHPMDKAMLWKGRCFKKLLFWLIYDICDI